jgi:hypothetical protein
MKTAIPFLSLLFWVGTGCASAPTKAKAPTVAGRTQAQWVADLDDDNEIVRLRAAKLLGSFGPLRETEGAMRHAQSAKRSLPGRSRWVTVVCCPSRS